MRSFRTPRSEPDAGSDERPTWRRTLPNHDRHPRAASDGATDGRQVIAEDAAMVNTRTYERLPGAGAIAPPPLRPSGLCVTTMRDGDEEVVMFSYAATSGPDKDCLTPAEREILTPLLKGERDADIAASRGRAVRTVVNQVRGLFTKFGVNSRSEFIAAFLQGRKPRRR